MSKWENPKIKMFEDIVRERAAREYGDTIIDMQSANAVLTVFNALGDKNKEHFVSLPVEKMISLAWALLEQSGGGLK